MTRLGYFWTFLVANFRTKVAQILGFLKKSFVATLWATFETLGCFLMDHPNHFFNNLLRLFRQTRIFTTNLRGKMSIESRVANLQPSEPLGRWTNPPPNWATFYSIIWSHWMAAATRQRLSRLRSVTKWKQLFWGDDQVWRRDREWGQPSQKCSLRIERQKTFLLNIHLLLQKNIPLRLLLAQSCYGQTCCIIRLKATPCNVRLHITQGVRSVF